MTARSSSGSGRTTRRKILISTLGTAAMVAAPRIALAQKRAIKVGLVTPTTGPLAFFAQCDSYVVPQFRKAVAGGIKVGGVSYPVELIVKDSQSNPNRASEVASDLILGEKVDLMLAAHTPETTNPVADQCEINGVPCINTDCPWQSWFFPRHGDPKKGFKWTYLFFFGVEQIGAMFLDVFAGVPTNKVVAELYPNDTDGNALGDPKTGLPGVIAKGGYKQIDPGRFDPSIENFSSQISAFKTADCEIYTSALDPPVFINFWTQCAQQGWKPKIAIPGKSVEFPPAIKALGPLAKNLCIEVWWSPNHPFRSHLTGQTSAELACDYTKVTGRPWYMVLGYKHALFEVAADVLKRSKSLEPEAIRELILATHYDSIIGPLQWQKGPVPSVCTTPIVGGQWQEGADGQMHLQIINNHEYPIIKTTAKQLSL